MAFLGMLLLVLLGFQKYTDKSGKPFPEVTFISESLPIESLSEFDPNDLDKNQWQKLGFSEKQTATILKYKKMLAENSFQKSNSKNVMLFLKKNIPNSILLFYCLKPIWKQNPEIQVLKVMKRNL